MIINTNEFSELGPLEDIAVLTKYLNNIFDIEEFEDKKTETVKIDMGAEIKKPSYEESPHEEVDELISCPMVSRSRKYTTTGLSYGSWEVDRFSGVQNPRKINGKWEPNLNWKPKKSPTSNQKVVDFSRDRDGNVDINSIVSGLSTVVISMREDYKRKKDGKYIINAQSNISKEKNISKEDNIIIDKKIRIIDKKIKKIELMAKRLGF